MVKKLKKDNSGSVKASGVSEEVVNHASELKHSEKKYKVLYQSSRDAIMTLNPPSWSFTSGNKSTVKMFKCKDEKDFISYAPYELSPIHQPDGKLSKTKALEMINKAMKDGSHFFEWRHKRSNREEFPATVLLTRVEIEKGKPFLQATVRDITERKKTEKALKESELKYKELIDNAGDGIFVSNERMKFIEVNKKAAEMFGYTRDELFNLGIMDLVADKEKASKIPNSMHIFKDSSSTFICGKMLRKDGKAIDVEINLNLISREPLRVMAIVRDTTEKKRLLDKIKRLEENRIKLTDNEKTILFALSAYPNSTDQEISDKFKVKRSTVTAIKNKFRNENYLSTYKIISPILVNCKMLALTYCKLQDGNTLTDVLKNVKKPSSVLFAVATHKDLIFITVGENFSEVGWSINQMLPQIESEIGRASCRERV